MVDPVGWAMLLFVASVPYLLSLPAELIDIDTAQYAEIAREMVSGGHWVFLRDNGRNYLDKPILTFWTIALSFKILGIGNVSFRLPAVLMTFLTSWSVGRIVRLRGGGREQAWLASVLYLGLPGVFLMAFQPIIDVYLVAYLTLTHHAFYLGQKRHRGYYLLMYLFVGMGFITKGPIAVVIPALSIGGDIAFRRDWDRLKSLHVLPGILIAGALPAAWSYALYLEFGSYGPYFFLWLQSFGRFYSKIYDYGLNPAFFVASFCWASASVFFPLVAPIVGRVSVLRGPRAFFSAGWAYVRSPEFRAGDYTITLWLWLYLFLISFSRFQLPQYVYWVLPAAAILASERIYERLFVREARLSVAILGVPVLAFLMAVLLPVVSVDLDWRFLLPLLLVLPAGLAWSLRRSGAWAQISLLVVSMSLLTGLGAWVVFPQLIRYQPASQVAAILAAEEPGKDHFYSFGVPLSKRSYMFYSGRVMRIPVNRLRFLDTVGRDEPLCLIPTDVLPLFESYAGGRLELVPVARFPTYKMSTPTLRFLNKRTRSEVLKEVGVYRVRLKGAEACRPSLRRSARGC